MTMNSVNDRLDEADGDTKYDGYLIGEVVENLDPLGIGRIKVKIPELYDPAQGPVPWIGPHKKSPFGIGANYGVYGSPAIGSKVRVKLQDNDPHYALFEADEYDRAVANPKFASPKTWGFKDPGGSELFVNYDTQQWEFTHSSGVTLKHDSAGNMTLHVPGSRTEDTGDNLTVSAGQAVSVTAGTSMTLGAGTTMEINVSSSLTVTAQSVTVQANTVSLQADTVSTSNKLQAGNGATGTFTSKENKVIGVTNGIVTSIT